MKGRMYGDDHRQVNSCIATLMNLSAWQGKAKMKL